MMIMIGDLNFLGSIIIGYAILLFRKMAEGEWTPYHVIGWKGFILKEKHKRLKGTL
jgi:hypothetical protein